MSAGDFDLSSLLDNKVYPVGGAYAITTTVSSSSYTYPTPYLPAPNLMEKVVEQNTKKEEPIFVIPEKKKRKFNL